MKLKNKKIIGVFIMILAFLVTGCGSERDRREEVSLVEEIESEQEEKQEPEQKPEQEQKQEQESTKEISAVVFIGLKGSAMTLYDDGTADYYWNGGESIEEGNTWVAKDNVITVHLPSLNCDIKGTVEKNNSFVMFKSESITWDDELFFGAGSVQKRPTVEEYDQWIQGVQEAYQNEIQKAKDLAENDASEKAEETQGSENVVTESSDESGNVDSDDIRPEFKEAMDSYEAFYDEYCDLLKQYAQNPSDLALLSKYADMMQKVVEVDEKFKAWDEKEMTTAEQKYYIEVTARITQKLLEVN